MAPHSKYAITLLGPATRVMGGEEAATVVWGTEWRGEDEEGRTEIVEKLGGLEEVKIGRGEVIRFSWGVEEAPVHSEPDSQGRRGCLSVSCLGARRRLGRYVSGGKRRLRIKGA